MDKLSQLVVSRPCLVVSTGIARPSSGSYSFELHLHNVWWNHCEAVNGHCGVSMVVWKTIYWVDYCLCQVLDADRVWVLFVFIAPGMIGPSPCVLVFSDSFGVGLRHNKSMEAGCLWEFLQHMIDSCVVSLDVVADQPCYRERGQVFGFTTRVEWEDGSMEP